MNTIWPKEHLTLSATELEKIREQLQPDFSRLLKSQKLPEELTFLLDDLYLPLSAWLVGQCKKDKPLLVGINGSQGSGKSTLCHLLKFLFEVGFDLKSCVLSIDDLYLTHAERQQLGRDIHPLLVTRGVPGTHDIPLALEVFDRLIHATEDLTTPIPRFDKASDDRLPRQGWDLFRGRPDLILFEGWCVGAAPQAQPELELPVNLLEEQEDATGRWREYVNQQLSGPYQKLFDRLDLLMMLKVPDWQQVYQWRRKQEKQLIACNPTGTRIMDDDALHRFIMHYERLTRHQLDEMPGRADLLLLLNAAQQIDSIELK